jgi:hypothetical protein
VGTGKEAKEAVSFCEALGQPQAKSHEMPPSILSFCRFGEVWTHSLG